MLYIYIYIYILYIYKEKQNIVFYKSVFLRFIHFLYILTRIFSFKYTQYIYMLKDGILNVFKFQNAVVCT